jgi:hypothetical protein
MHALLAATWPSLPAPALAAIQFLGVMMAVTAVHLLLTLYGQAAWRAGAYRPDGPPPPGLPTPVQLAESIGYFAGMVLAPVALDAGLQLPWSYGWPPFFQTAYLILLTNVVADIIYFFVHWWLHTNKAAYRWSHSHHHKRIDNLAKGTVLDGVLTVSTFVTANFILINKIQGNYWAFLLSALTQATFAQVVHIGPDAGRFQHPIELAIGVLSPASPLMYMLPIVQRSYHHIIHHTHVRWDLLAQGVFRCAAAVMSACSHWQTARPLLPTVACSQLHSALIVGSYCGRIRAWDAGNRLWPRLAYIGSDRSGIISIPSHMCAGASATSAKLCDLQGLSCRKVSGTH